LTKNPTPHWKHEILLLWWLLRNLGRYRVVHCHTHIDRHFLAYMLIKLWGKRLVLSATLDDSLPGLLLTYRKMNRPLVSRLFSLFDALVAISPKLKAESDQMAPPERVHLVPVGVGIPTTTMRRRDAMRAEHRVAIDDMVMIFVGGICDRKDPLFLVEQLPSIMRFCPRAKLFIVGPVLETNHLSRMIEVIRDHRLEGRVVFIGEVDDPDPFYEMADIMTFPSHLEGFGSVVVEAMAHGLPVIVRHLPGVNDVFVKEAETGFLFDTAEEFNEAVHKLSEDPALRQKIGRAARRLAIEQFGLMPIAKQYFMIYGVSWCAAPADDAQSAATIDTLDRVAATLPASTSIIDPRFRTAIALPADQRPLLVTTVDAEEDFDWSGPFLRS